MSYKTQAQLSMDSELTQRIAAAVAREGYTGNPMQWAVDRQWRLAAEPGWDEAYASALAAGRRSPASDADVITDAMILAAVQKLLAEERVAQQKEAAQTTASEPVVVMNTEATNYEIPQ